MRFKGSYPFKPYLPANLVRKVYTGNYETEEIIQADQKGQGLAEKSRRKS